jgi:3-hydroxyisobutyrate dehydrogenase-like beta-hydroxyacid dehydrogenase
MRVGFVGLGNIGRPMAERLVAAGLETTVFDLREEAVRALAERGARPAASPRDVARASEQVGVCVRDDAGVRAVFEAGDGLLAGAAPDLVVAVHSTVRPDTVVDLARGAAAFGVGVVDACVSGGAAGAAKGELLVMAGGDAAHVERCAPAFGAFARRVIHAGPVGSGARAKLCNNVMTYLAWTAAFEAMLLARSAGLPQEVFEEVTGATGNLTDPMRAFLALYKVPEAARRSDAVQAILRGHVEVAEKDLALALELAREGGVALPGAGVAAQIMARVYGLEDERRR